MKFEDIKTKKAKHEFIKGQLKVNDRWLLSGLITIFDFQTQDEKNSASTSEHNGVGFSGFDAELMTSLAKAVISKGGRRIIKSQARVNATDILTEKQTQLLRIKMQKYAGQLTRISINKINKN